MTSPAVRDDRRGYIQTILPEGTEPPPSVPAEMFAAAVSVYLSGHRLDMRSLARHLGVGRATLYRRTGNREQLLDEVIWWRARRMLARQLLVTTGLSGADRIAAVVGGSLEAIAQDRPLRALISAEPDTALHILAGRGLAATGMTGALAHLIDAERRGGRFHADLDSPMLADAIMRIAAGFLYADLFAAPAPGVGRAVTVIRALLTGLDRPQAPAGHGERQSE